jgi:plastocyanin
VPQKIDRRVFILIGTGALAGAADAAAQANLVMTARPGVPRILTQFSYGRAIYYFNPAGLYVQPGQTVQWAGVGRRSVRSFHPSMDNHELRIPEKAKPFDSKAAGAKGIFEWTFEEEGTYDYYSPSEEYLGMVGRIVVGKPGGPAEKPPGYGNRDGYAVMYPDAAKMLNYLKPDEIVRKQSVPCPMELLERKFPWR